MGQPCSVQKPHCCSVRSGTNSLVTGTPDYDVRPPGATRTQSEVRLLICALDYKKTKCPLTCTRDGKNMQDMAKECGVKDITVMYDEQCTRSNVKKAVGKIGSRCKPNDFFVFYYSGHGTQVPDKDHEEKDGKDEAFCFVTPQGQVTRNSLLTDDEFADLLTSSMPETTNVLVLADCCHSGSILDLQKKAWDKRCAISIVGCMDAETSSDIGVGGLFTHSMLLAMEKLYEEEHYSIGKLYNTTVKENDRVFHGKQAITITCSSKTAPNHQPWPFVPREPYRSPLRNAKNVSQRYNLDAGNNNRDIDIGGYKDVPDDLAQWAAENDIDLGTDYEDEELENGWKPGKALLNKLGF